MVNDVGDHGVDPFPVAVAEDVQAVLRQFEGLEDAGAQRVVQVVVQVGDPVGPADAFRLHGGRFGLSGMGQDPLADFFGQVQALAAVFQKFHHAQALLVMAETFRQKVVQRPFPDVSVGGVPQVVPQGDGFGEIFVQAERTGQRARDLGDLQRMGQPGTVVIPLRGEKHLRLEFQAAEGLAVDDPVPVALVFRPQVAGFDGPFPAGGLGGAGGPWSEQLFLLLFLSFTDRHRKSLLSSCAYRSNGTFIYTTQSPEFLPELDKELESATISNNSEFIIQNS